MGDRVINDTCWMSHQGFFRGKQKQSSPLVLVILQQYLVVDYILLLIFSKLVGLVM